MTPAEFKAKFRAGQKVAIAVIGDSTSCGFGANPGPNTWTDGNSYLCVNGGTGPNWTAGDPYFINLSGYPSQAQQDNTGIPSAVRLLRTYVEGINPASRVYNYGWSGGTAQTHVSAGTVATIAALTPKPDVVFIATGINDAKQNLHQAQALAILVVQCLDAGMLPVLCKEHNIAVAGGPAGAWSASALPDNWYPMDNWPAIRANVDAMAATYNLEVIDLGTPDCAIDPSLLYDPFHPSAKGYRVIYEKYRAWLGEAGPVRIKGHIAASGGPIRIKTSAGIAEFTLPIWMKKA